MNDLSFDKKDVYSWSNAEEANQYIGQLCYFGNNLQELQKNIEIGHCRTLVYIHTDPTIAINNVFESFYENRYSKDDRYSTGFMIPMDKVKKQEKKWRPFTLEEFNKVIPMGIVFKYKYKRNNVNDVYSVYYHANLDCENGFQAIFFEDSYHDFDYCFNEMKLFLNGKWQPFGVEK